MQLTVVVRFTIGFPYRNSGVRGGGETMSVDVANVLNPLRGVRGEVGSTDFCSTAE